MADFTQIVHRVVNSTRRWVIDTNGSGQVTLADAAGGTGVFPAAVALADNLPNPTTTEIGANELIYDSTISTWARQYSFRGAGDAGPGSVTAAVGMMAYNGGGASVGTDRWYNNTAVTLLASAAQTLTQTSADLVAYNGSALHVIVDVTTPGTGSITLTINGKDPASGKYYLLLSGTAITTTSTNIYRIAPGVTAAGNANATDLVPRIFQIKITANNANSMTYSVGYNLRAN